MLSKKKKLLAFNYIRQSEISIETKHTSGDHRKRKKEREIATKYVYKNCLFHNILYF